MSAAFAHVRWHPTLVLEAIIADARQPGAAGWDARADLQVLAYLRRRSRPSKAKPYRAPTSEELVRQLWRWAKWTRVGDGGVPEGWTEGERPAT